jgi:hypothetical protein
LRKFFSFFGISVDHSYVKWTNCNDQVASAYTRSPSALPLYPDILSTDIKTLIFSGDADSVVNFIGTERWISSEGLQLNILEKWHAWFGPDKQLAGYTQKYDGLTFKTVKGAGHMVATTRPLHALYMFECFLYGTELCAAFDYPRDNLEYLSGVSPRQGVESFAVMKEGEASSKMMTVEPDHSSIRPLLSVFVLACGTICILLAVVMMKMSTKVKSKWNTYLTTDRQSTDTTALTKQKKHLPKYGHD